MADEERKTSKRSRFDQKEPDVKRNSRFDRRSRSPTSRTSEARRSRSPLPPKTPFSPDTENRKTPSDPATAAGEQTIVIGQWRKVNMSFSGRSSSNQCLDTSQKGDTTCRRPSDPCCESFLVFQILTIFDNISDRKPCSKSIIA